MTRVSAVRTSIQSIIKKATGFVSHKGAKLGTDVPDSFASSKVSKVASEAEDALDSFQVLNPVRVATKAGEVLGALPSKIEPLGDSKEDLLLKYSINVLERANGANVEKMPRPENFPIDTAVDDQGNLIFTNYMMDQAIPKNRLPDTIDMFKNLSQMKERHSYSSNDRIFNSESLFHYAKLATAPEHFTLIKKLAPYSKSHECFERDNLADLLRSLRTPELLKFANKMADVKCADGTQQHSAFTIKSILKQIASTASDIRKDKACKENNFSRTASLEFFNELLSGISPAIKANGYSPSDSLKFFDELVSGVSAYGGSRKFSKAEAAKLATLSTNSRKIDLVKTLAANPNNSVGMIAQSVKLSDYLAKSKLPIDDWGNILVHDPAVYWYRGGGVVIIRGGGGNPDYSKMAKLTDWDDIYD